MTPFDNVGRIHKKAFLVSNLVLFALCLASACVRYYIRIYIQRQFSIDDGILLFGIACLVSAVVLLYRFIDELYLVGALQEGTPGISLPSDFISQAFDFDKLSTVAEVLTWCSLVSVKFSYLFLFKKLIDRIRPMIIYWWVTAVFNGVASVYVAALYGAVCPYYYSTKAFQCSYGKGLDRTIGFAISQFALDTIGDLMILYIPFRLIWKVKLRWTQKLALALTLCLTILTILVNTTALAGIHTDRGTVPSIDTIWEMYWQYVAANIALTMTAATAFRTFFLSKTQQNRVRKSPDGQNSLQSKLRRILRLVFNPYSWRSKYTASSTGNHENRDRPDDEFDLPPIDQRATMTGMRTFINQRGQSGLNASSIMNSVHSETDDFQPLSPSDRTRPAIHVKRGFSVHATRR